MGSQAARKLEKGTGRPIGWMDADHEKRESSDGSFPDWPLQKVTLERLQALTLQQRQRADAAIDDLLRGYEAERATLNK